MTADSKIIMIIDTETTGLPKDWKASPEQFELWPRITQLAFTVFDQTGKELFRFCSLIKPDGWVIPDEPFFRNNNMSTERCEAEGMPIAEALALLIDWRKQADITAAHNMSFDAKIIRAEMFRLGDHTEFTGRKVCTKTNSTSYCAIPGSRGYKWPTLAELHNKLFGCDFDGAHDAMNDVMACAKCFFELVKLGVISLDPKPAVESIEEQFKDM